MHAITEVPTSLIDADAPSGAFLDVVREVYGEREAFVEERAAAWSQIVRAFLKRFGPRERMMLIRAPARANLLGKHSDFQGGRFNCICLPTEMITVAAPRADDRLVLGDVRSHLFPDAEVAIGDLLPPSQRHSAWTDYLIGASETIGASWLNYIAGSFIYLQNRFPDQTMRGIDAMIAGNIVSAAGLSSSSALSVAAMLAATTVNGIERSWPELAAWAGEAEWFAGTRGGAGDHAAIMLTPFEKLAHMRAKPTVEFEAYPFPSNGEIVAIYSGRIANKSRIANRNIYNTHSASYRFGVELLRQQLADRGGIDMIADLIDERMGLSERDILDAIASLPERASRRELKRWLPIDARTFEEIICSHDEPQDGYPIRRVCLFGVAEFSRSRRVPELVRAGDVQELGRLMTLSHDGDRVVRRVGDRLVPHDNEASDERMAMLWRDACDRPGELPTLPNVPGGYGNSCADLDEIADVYLNVDGVFGVTLTGAGLGGHLLALVEPGRQDELVAALRRDYFGDEDDSWCAYACPAVGGASLHRLT